MRLIKKLVFVMGFVYALTANAEVQLSAHQVMENTTAEVMAVLAEAREYHQTEPERYYQEIHRVLDDLVDFGAFSRGVMGDHASGEHYRSLDREGKIKLREQVKRLSSVIRVALVRTYGKGLLAFSGSEVEILPPDLAEDEASGATVVQLIRGSGEQPYEIRYKLRKDSKGKWTLRNITVESVNLGQIYRSQFEAALKEYQGDIDKVIDNWSVNSTEST